jgi:hypothetical protein
MKPCVIKQPAGIGDVFFLQKIAHLYREKDCKIIWALRDDIYWISEYISDIEWYKLSEDFPGKNLFNYSGFTENDEFVYIDTSTADVVFNADPTRIMSSKFGLVGLDHTDWANYFKFNRNREREDSLYYDVLNLKDDSEYVYVNDWTNTDARRTTSLSSREYAYPVVENRFIDGYTLFDWTKVFENAKEIHSAPTALSFIVDTLDSDAKVYYYPHDARQHKDVEDLFLKVTEYRNA